MPLGAFRQSLNLANPVITDTTARSKSARFYSTYTATSPSSGGNFTGYLSMPPDTYCDITVYPTDGTWYYNSTKAWTTEWWWKRNGTFAETNGTIWLPDGLGTAALSIEQFNATQYRVNLSSSVIYTGTFPTSWQHFALVSNGSSNLKVFVNGSQVASVSYTRTDSIRKTQFANQGNTAGSTLDFDEYRISTSARYTGSFTPSASAFTNDANTLALFHFNGNVVDDNTPVYVPPYLVFGTTNTMGYRVYDQGNSSTSLNWTNLTKPTLANEVFGVSFSSNGTYLAVANGNQPSGYVYKRGVTDRYESTVASLSTNGDGGACAFSQNDTYLAHGTASSPFMYMYKRSGDTFTSITVPAAAGYVRHIAWSADNTYMAVGSQSSPFIQIYKRSGDTFTILSNPATLPGGAVRGCQFSPNGNYLAVATDSSPFVIMYSRSGDTFTKLADSNFDTRPSAAATAVAWSADGTYIAFQANTTPFLFWYSHNGSGGFTKQSNPATLPPGNAGFPGTGISWSADGNYLAVGSGTTPFMRIYSRSGGTLTSVSTPTTPSGRVNDLQFLPRAMFNGT
jgi:WD40 repeat protein